MPVAVSKPSVRNVMKASQCLYPDSKEVEAYREDYVVISGESGDYYIGRWLTGLGIYGVKFPKATTRRLTTAERAAYKRINLVM